MFMYVGLCICVCIHYIQTHMPILAYNGMDYIIYIEIYVSRRGERVLRAGFGETWVL